MLTAPSTIYGDICIAPSSGFIRAVVDGGAPDSSSRVDGLDGRSCVLVGGATYCPATGAAAYCFVFPLTVTTPRGPGILSLRQA